MENNRHCCSLVDKKGCFVLRMLKEVFNIAQKCMDIANITSEILRPDMT